jgi:hypothetical protein
VVGLLKAMGQVRIYLHCIHHFTAFKSNLAGNQSNVSREKWRGPPSGDISITSLIAPFVRESVAQLPNSSVRFVETSYIDKYNLNRGVLQDEVVRFERRYGNVPNPTPVYYQGMHAEQEEVKKLTIRIPARPKVGELGSEAQPVRKRAVVVGKRGVIAGIKASDILQA